MTWHSWTAAGLVLAGAGVAFVLVALDVSLVLRDRASISERLLSLARRQPVVPALVGLLIGLGAGLLLGHLFLPQSEN